MEKNSLIPEDGPNGLQDVMSDERFNVEVTWSGPKEDIKRFLWAVANYDFDSEEFSDDFDDTECASIEMAIECLKEKDQSFICKFIESIDDNDNEIQGLRIYKEGISFFFSEFPSPDNPCLNLYPFKEYCKNLSFHFNYSDVGMDGGFNQIYKGAKRVKSYFSSFEYNATPNIALNKLSFSGADKDIAELKANIISSSYDEYAGWQGEHLTLYDYYAYEFFSPCPRCEIRDLEIGKNYIIYLVLETWFDENTLSHSLYLAKELSAAFPKIDFELTYHCANDVLNPETVLFKNGSCISREQNKKAKEVIDAIPKNIKNKNEFFYYDYDFSDKPLEYITKTLAWKGDALEYVPNNLKTPELCLIAVQESEYALKYVPKELREKIAKQAGIDYDPDDYDDNEKSIFDDDDEDSAPTAQLSTDQKACPSCGKQLKSTAKFCGKCGMKLDNVCSNCGKVLKEGAKFCGKCGTKQ